MRARDSIRENRAVGAFALHINMINAANIVARRISHGHVTVCTAISEGQGRGERERDLYGNQVVFFVFRFFFFFFIFVLNTRTIRNTAAIDERVDDRRLWTLLIYSSMKMVINLDTGDRNRLAPSGTTCVRSHTRAIHRIRGTAFGD